MNMPGEPRHTDTAASSKTPSTGRPGRLRFTCDSCHQLKIKCSRTRPCSACQLSGTHCNYSPAVQPGRPKGSKNKRTLRREEEGKHGRAAPEAGSQAQGGMGMGGGGGRIGGAYATTLPVPVGDDLGSHWQQLQHHHGLMMDLQFDLGGVGHDPAPAQDVAARLHPSPPDLAYDPVYSQNAAAGVMGFQIPPGSSPYDTSTGPSTSTSTGSYGGALGPFVAADGAAFSSRRESVASDFLGPPASEPPSSSALSTPGPPHHAQHTQRQCACLQQHVQLVYRLEDLHSSTSPTVENVVRGVQEAQPVWRGFAQCSQCRSGRGGNGRREVFLLFTTSIRALLSSVAKLSLSSGLLGEPASSSSSSSSSSPPPPRRPGGGGGRAVDDVGVWVGSLELAGEIKEEVVGAVLRAALHGIRPAVAYLWEHSSRPPAPALSSRYGTEGLSPACGQSPLHGGWGSHSQGRSMGSVEPPLASLLDTLQSITHAVKEGSRP